MAQYAVRGQYGPGDHDGGHTNGYRRAKGVDPQSTTETFAAVKMYIDNWRWNGTPFYLRTGKCLPKKSSEIAIRFRRPPIALFQKQCESPVYANDLIIHVSPNAGITLRVNGKVPGTALNIKQVAFDFNYAETFKKQDLVTDDRHDAVLPAHAEVGVEHLVGVAELVRALRDLVADGVDVVAADPHGERHDREHRPASRRGDF